LKFFIYNTLKTPTKTPLKQQIKSKKYFLPERDSSICDFNKFLIKNGLSLKSRYLLSDIFKNFNHFFYFNSNFIFKNYQSQR
jgi:hypothetical protein